MSTMDLVLQGPGMTDSLLEQAAAIACANSLQPIQSPRIVRLFDVDTSTRDEIALWAKQHKVDYAFLPFRAPLSSMKVLAFDMDSTLINIECIDEIARQSGLGDKMAALTEQAMRGEVPSFDESLKMRVKLLAGTSVEVLEKVYEERLAFNPGAERLIQAAQKAGLKTMIVSGGFTFFTDKLKAKLGLDHAFSNRLEIENGKLTGRILGDIVNAHAKARYLHEVAQGQVDQCIALGDGANDIPMIESAGVSVAYHGKPILQQHAKYTINYNGLDAILNWFVA